MTEIDPVVVGADGSEDSLHAVRWAAELASRNGCDLVVLHTWTTPLLSARQDPVPGAPERDGPLELAERTLGDAVEVAREHRSTLEVVGRLASTSPAVALKEQSESASAVVIGSHGYGKVGSFLLGSVGVDLAGHTRCPLVVIRGVISATGPVVVGVDDSARTTEALAFAFREAAARGTALRAVHAWTLPTIVPDWPGGMPELLDDADRNAREALESMVEPFRASYPDVTVEYVAPTGSPGRNLVEASVDAQLIVVGTRGRGGFRGLMLGSTSHTLIHHAECPVAVVPHRVNVEEGDDEPSGHSDLRA